MRGIQKITALFLICAVVLFSSVSAFGAEVPEPVSYSNWGSKTVCEALGIDTAEYYKWIVNHDNDSSNDYQTYTTASNYDSSKGTNYYLGTKYTSGDHRTPNGDTKGYFSTDLYSPSSGYYCVGYGRMDELNGSSYKPQMNCTGFVWHILYKSLANTKAQKGQKLSYAYANTHIPSYSYAPYDTGQDTWVNWASNNNIKTYYFDGYNAISNALNSRVLEKGDIIFMLGTADAHVGIFYGNSSNDNKFWHSKYQSVNTITNIEPRGTCYGLYVYKTGCSNGIDLNIQLNSTQSGLNGTVYNFSDFEYTVYTDSECKNAIGKIVPQADGFGAFGLTSAQQYTSSNSVARGVPVANRSYWCKETKTPNGYVADNNVYKFEKSTLSWGGVARYYAGVTVNENGHSFKKISKTPKIALRIQNLSANSELTEFNEKYGLDGAIYEVFNLNDTFCGYMKTDKDGWVCATSTTYEENLNDIQWNESDYDSALYLPYGDYYAKQIVAPNGFDFYSEKIMLNNVYQYTWSGLTVCYAQIYVQPTAFDVSFIRVKLLNNAEKPVSNVEFELFADENCTQLIDVGVTDDNGIAVFNKGAKLGVYYIKQKSTAVGYFNDLAVKEVAVLADHIGDFTDATMLAKSKGDVNKDGNIDIKDVTLIQLYVVGEKAENGSDLIDVTDLNNFENTDIDGNGVININDITQLQILISKTVD